MCRPEAGLEELAHEDEDLFDEEHRSTEQHCTGVVLCTKMQELILMTCLMSYPGAQNSITLIWYCVPTA